MKWKWKQTSEIGICSKSYLPNVFLFRIREEKAWKEKARSPLNWSLEMYVHIFVCLLFWHNSIVFWVFETNSVINPRVMTTTWAKKFATHEDFPLIRLYIIVPLKCIMYYMVSSFHGIWFGFYSHKGNKANPYRFGFGFGLQFASQHNNVKLF